MPFTKLGLSDKLVQGILATGYTAPTAIQSQAIPLAIAGRDIIGCAQTGTGKTAAFVLPMINHFIKSKSNGLRGLILTPTRELAQQVESFITGYARFANISSLSVYGGVNIDNQIKRLKRKVDIVVATPGRLIDHMNRKTIDLSHVEIFVLDEADRMFDMGFIQDVKKIIAKIPNKRQTFLFSATISSEVKSLISSIQNNPELIMIGEQRKPADTVKQIFYSIHQDKKMDLLLHILKEKNLDCVLIFSRTKHGADKISYRLERNGIKAVAIHSNRTQAQRQRALSGFKNGQYNVMVATDIAARGIDVEGISHVINYDIPTFAEDYIHRIGRTGRASATGDAITFVSNAETKHLKSIERYTGKHYELKRYATFDYNAKPIQTVKDEPRNDNNFRNNNKNRFDGRNKNKQHKSKFNSSDKNYNRNSNSGFSKRKEKNYNLIDNKNSMHNKTSVEPKKSTPRVDNDWRSIINQFEKDKQSKPKKKIKKLFFRDSL